MSQPSNIELLKNMPIFGGLTEDTLEFILSRAATVECERNEYFFHEGESGDSMYVLQKGRVGAFKMLNGNPFLLREMKLGDCFGEMALIDLGPRSASVRSLETSKAIEIKSQCLLDLYQHNQTQLTLIYMNVARELSRRLRYADQQLFEVITKRDENTLIGNVLTIA